MLRVQIEAARYMVDFKPGVVLLITQASMRFKFQFVVYFGSSRY